MFIATLIHSKFVSRRTRNTKTFNLEAINLKVEVFSRQYNYNTFECNLFSEACLGLQLQNLRQDNRSSFDCCTVPSTVPLKGETYVYQKSEHSQFY